MHRIVSSASIFLIFLIVPVVVAAQTSPGESGISLEQTIGSNAGIGNGSDWSTDDGERYFTSIPDSSENPDDPSHDAKAPKVEIDPGKSQKNANNSK
ncbi:hypothetical protein [Parasedimentitalea psychrophila]|uniref:Secreted protein n=1 Tax=Parasedimentitalea psychrophila TaxID=2997337 RepID=A0A9Y2KYG8_9RHOB|nr:hypothetical protein [Parasedimentitalea psychrophila]WIY24351.1 hypothetical protein QPJ95_17415 [Parasedimentitalea psychrophila]